MISLNYTPAQEQVFFSSDPKRFTIVSKGRRVGLTRGAGQAFIEYCINSKLRLLWGETIFSNVQRYIDLYFLPVLKGLPSAYWSWQPRLMQMKIGESVIDFRSADSPETWEGFGYHVIFLNEAGIILRNPDLYKKTVLPMLMDYPDSRLIAAGVPKGKTIKGGVIHPFYELWEKALENPSSYVRYKFSSYSNPFLKPEDVKEIESALDSKMQLQEIHGEFIDITDNPYLYTFDSDGHVLHDPFVPDLTKPIWFSFDFNVEPNSCIIGQQPDHYGGIIFDEVSVQGSTEEVCNTLLAKYSHWIDRGIVFVTGDATGNSRNSISGPLTNYILIKKKLKLRDSQLKVRRVNEDLKSSRILCNGVLSKLEVSISKKCAQTIADCQMASVDMAGDLIKSSGLHKFDCFRYMIGAWFPDFLVKGSKYVRVKKEEVYKSKLEKHLTKQI